MIISKVIKVKRLLDSRVVFVLLMYNNANLHLTEPILSC